MKLLQQRVLIIVNTKPELYSALVQRIPRPPLSKKAHRVDINTF